MFWSTIKYDVSTSIGYGVSSSLSNTAYPPQQINTAYPLPLDTAYRSSGTETEILDFHAKKFLPSFRTNPTDCLSLVFRSLKKHFKSLSLDELRSPDFNILSDKEYLEEEEEEAMAETMEQYMSKTRTDYGSGRFKELLMKCPQHYLTKMQEVILFYNGLDILTRQILDSRGAVPTKTAADAKKAIQEMAEYSQKWHNETSRGKIGCEQCKGPHYTKDCPQKEEGKTIKEAYYTQFDGPFQGGGYRATAPGYYQRNNANHSFQERRQSMEETLSKFMSESTKRHEENSNLIKEIRASTDAAIRKQRASIKTLKIPIGQMSKVLQEKGFGSLPSSTETNPRDQVKSISTTIKADSNSICRIGSTQYVVSTGHNRTLFYKPRQTTVLFPGRLEDHYCEEEGIYGPKFTEAYGASLINNIVP
ncbi:hypothetical protein Tco_0925723 [Tanacetum coccineum]|uniref:Retrotransposon gag domain-containing protein n=1 Tax=Tanacetum coccineum TaxID=301880 RepID=A0ABQ5DEQ2_9ASTR